MKTLGADSTVNYKANEPYPQNVDALIDLVNKAETFNKMTALVKSGGTVLTTQFVADKKAIESQLLHGGNFETKGSPASLDALRSAIDKGELKIPIDRKIELAAAPAAIAESREQKSNGKTIIVINGQL